MGYECTVAGTLVLTPSLLPAQLSELAAMLDAPDVRERFGFAEGRAPVRIETPDDLVWEATEPLPASTVERCLAWLAAELSERFDAKVIGTLTYEGEDGSRGMIHVDGGDATWRMDDTDLDAELTAMLEALRDRAADTRLRADAAGFVVHHRGVRTTEVFGVLAEVVAPAEALEVIIAAAEAIGDAGADAAPLVPTLIDLLSAPDPQRRYWATYALGRIGPAARGAVPTLRRLVDDREPGPRHGAIDALAKLAPEE